MSNIEQSERIAQIAAHRACCGTEHNPAEGKLHGYCVVCGVPWPCDYAGKPPPTLPVPDGADLRNMLRAMQNGELTVSRGVELVDMWLAGNYSDDQLPPVREGLGEDEMPWDRIDALMKQCDELQQARAICPNCSRLIDEAAGVDVSAKNRRISELEQQRDKLLALVESAFKEGFCAPATYNDTVLNDMDDEWGKSESHAAIAKVKP